MAVAAALLCTAAAVRADGSGAAEPAAGTPPCSLGYVLQAARLASNRLAALDRLADSGRDVLVLDRAWSGRFEHWSIPELEALRRARPGRRVMAYLSIGEAEDYRAYWQRDWQIDAAGARSAQTPAFVVAPNPDWPGNYKVRYWDRSWQRLVLDDLETVLEQEFDGIYLDIVDAFQYFEHDPTNGTWEAERVNPQTGRSYRADMVSWVRRLAAFARRHRPEFAVVPQNGSALLHDRAYLETVDAIAVEDLFTLGDATQSAAHTVRVLDDLALMRAAGKPVFVVEYATDGALRERARAAAAAHDLVLLFADRALGTLGTAHPPPRCARAGR